MPSSVITVMKYILLASAYLAEEEVPHDQQVPPEHVDDHRFAVWTDAREPVD